MKLPFVITVPHCSNRIPEETISALALTDEEIEESTDIGTKDIFGSLPAKVLLCASWSRLLVDLNRGSNERGPKGVVAEVDYHGRSVYYRGLVPDKRDVTKRLHKYYFPFHRQLRNALSRPDIQGLFDCHSLNGIGPAEAPDPGNKREDIVLGNNGDRQGNIKQALGNTTCSAETLHLIEEAFKKSGFSVSLNHPYSGGFITTKYGQEWVKKGKIAIQIEINQDLYIYPKSMQIVPERLKDVKGRILRSFKEISKRF